MIRDRDGDINQLFRVIADDEVWMQPNGTIKTKYPGELIGPRWYYREVPPDWKETSNHFRFWENKPPADPQVLV
jgi:hypothetical protein